MAYILLASSGLSSTELIKRAHCEVKLAVKASLSRGLGAFAMGGVMDEGSLFADVVRVDVVKVFVLPRPDKLPIPFFLEDEDVELFRRNVAEL
jgi:hypothetical protein